MVGRDGRLLGLLMLGKRLSEEPYAGQDRRLLASAAGHAGSALESILLAEEIAQRMEAERRRGYEMEIAIRVQAGLFPQHLPALQTLEYAGRVHSGARGRRRLLRLCRVGPGRVGLVLADIVGKGMGAALLMANLQANLRNQYPVALDDLPRMLRSGEPAVPRLVSGEQLRYFVLWNLRRCHAPVVLRQLRSQPAVAAACRRPDGVAGGHRHCVGTLPQVGAHYH